MAGNTLKDKLIDDLWLPVAREGGKIICPKARNKKMKFLTLTNDMNFQEISKFEENKLTTKDRIFAWTYSLFKKLRLETDLAPAKVFGATRYEDSILRPQFLLSSYFPFDVINLDFSSQDPEMEAGRIEKEIKSMGKTIQLQKAQGNKFVLIYTTLLNFNNLKYGNIANTLGLSSQDFPSSIKDQMEKIECIEYVINRICSKHNYVGKFREESFPIDKKKYICSIAGLVNIE